MRSLSNCNLHKQRKRSVVMTFSHQIQHCFGIVHLKYKMCVTKKAKGINLINIHFPLKSIKIKQINHLKFYFHNT